MSAATTRDRDTGKAMTEMIEVLPRSVLLGPTLTASADVRIRFLALMERY